MKVLVTGGNGFLGSALIRTLLMNRFEVVALVRRASELRGLDQLGCQLVYGDVSDKESLRPAFVGVDAVFHLASIVSLYRSQSGELEQVNVVGTGNVVALCGELKIGRLVHVSSVVAVGAGETSAEVLNEDSPNRMRKFNFPNCETKTRGEELVLEACRLGALDAVVVNPSMVFGAGDARKAPRKGNILAARGKLAFYTRGGLSVVAVADVVAGMIAALQRGRKGERYILSGENMTMKDLLGMYAQCAHAVPPRHEIPSWLLRLVGRLIDFLKLRVPFGLEGAMAATSYHWFDHSKATRELGYHPRPALEAIRDSVSWMRQNGYLEFKP